MSERKYKSVAGYGVDISEHRMDDLDTFALQHIAKKQSPVVLDLGSGALGLSRRLASEGAMVVAVDQYDFSANLTASDNGIQVYSADMRDLEFVWRRYSIDDVVCQRTLHYVDYETAREVLSELYHHSNDQLFISVSGINSAIGECYPAAREPIATRFGVLTESGQEKFQITAPVCLYTKSEFITLLEDAGWEVVSCFESAFKNIKAICCHR
jgi:2-polyprenyl-3-methyl-5-hydroxy-6-metoxy-1,4-benzoquinol methylase